MSDFLNNLCQSVADFLSSGAPTIIVVRVLITRSPLAKFTMNGKSKGKRKKD